MRALILSVYVLLSCNMASAQYSKGDIHLGGVIGYSNSASTELKSTSLSIFPDIAYVNPERWLLGCSFGYLKETSKSVTRLIEENNSELFNLIPYVRRIVPLGERTRIFIQGDLSYATGTVESILTGTIVPIVTKGDITTYGLSVGAGMQYFFTNRILLEVSVGGLGYDKTKLDFPTAGRKQDTSNLDFNFDTTTLRIGFKYVVPSSQSQ